MRMSQDACSLSSIQPQALIRKVRSLQNDELAIGSATMYLAASAESQGSSRGSDLGWLDSCATTMVDESPSKRNVRHGHRHLGYAPYRLLDAVEPVQNLSYSRWGTVVSE